MSTISFADYDNVREFFDTCSQPNVNKKNQEKRNRKLRRLERYARSVHLLEKDEFLSTTRSKSIKDTRSGILELIGKDFYINQPLKILR